MVHCLFATDLHGQVERYLKLFAAVERERPAAVFLGGDLLPGLAALAGGAMASHPDFVNDFLAARLDGLRRRMGPDYPRVFVILGNDDPRTSEAAVLDVATRGLWSYLHDRHVRLEGFDVYGYACVPPTPFQLKDWERYDVSRYVDPGCVSPEEGERTVPVAPNEARYSTIKQDLDRLAGSADLSRALFLFHTPPYGTSLDRAALDGKTIDHVPLDVHVGSIAVRRFIEARQPLVSLHGHVHESARLTGSWRDRIGRTHLLGGAHDGPELVLVRVELDRPEAAERVLL